MNSSKTETDVKTRPALDRKRLFGISAAGQRVGTEKHLQEKTRPERK